METALEMLDGVEEELMSRSFLFVDPVSYRDGVGAATQAIRSLLARVPGAGSTVEERGKATS